MSGAYDRPKLKQDDIEWGWEGRGWVGGPTQINNQHRIEIEVVIKSHSIKISEPEEFTTKFYHT